MQSEKMLEHCKTALLEKNINPISSIDYDINGSIETITLEWIIEAYAQTEKSALFLELFDQVMQGSNEQIETFFQQMGQLVLMSTLSKEEFSL